MPSESRNASEDRASRLAGWLLRNRPMVLLIAAVLTIIGGYRTVRTYAGLRSDLEELLPAQAPSVLALEQARARLPGLRTLGIVVDTGGAANVPAANRFLDELAARLRAYPSDLVSAVQIDTTVERRFAETYALQLMDPADAKRLREAVEERRDWEVAKRTGTSIEDEDESPPPKVPLEELREKYERRYGPPRKYPNDRFVSEDGSTAVLLVRAASNATSYAADHELLSRVKADIAALGFPQAFAPSLRVGYAGDVPTRVEEMDGLAVDLGKSGAIVLLLVIGAIIAYFRSWRSLVILGFPLLCGTVCTFGLVALPPFSIRYLNSNTAFLGSIVVGNGLNSGVIVLARFREERLLGRDLEAAIKIMLSTTWRPTLAAASAATVAYGSLVFTDFRGFAQFGWLGGIGMLLVWVATILLVPPMAWRFGAKMAKPRTDHRRPGLKFVRAAVTRPKWVLAITGIVTLLAGLGIVKRGSDWIEYDLSKLRRRDSWTVGERYWGQRMDVTMGRFLTPTVVFASDAPQAEEIAERLRKLKDEDRAGGLIASVRSSADILSPHRAESLEEAKLLAKALTAKIKSTLSDQDRQIVERATSPEALTLLTPDKIPDTLAAGLRERDGRMDRSVLIFPKPGRGTWDAVKLTSFAADVRQAAASGDKAALVTGSLLLASDIAVAMKRDGPKATALALCMVLAICILSFRSVPLSLAAVGSLLVGVGMMLGLMAWIGEHLNFSNFVALPITFGIGADYSINVLKRYQQEGKVDLAGALSATGGAVALCSATTIIGYSSLLVAQNRALFSFGGFAVTGELTCLSTAVLALPALLTLGQRRAREPAPAPAGE